MTPRKQLGPYRLTSLLAEDPYGTLHRAVRVEGGAFGRHALVRAFGASWLEAGLAGRLNEAVALSLKVGEQPGLAPHLRVYHGSQAFLSYDLVPGRSLAQALAACRAQHIPLSMEHIFTVLRDLSEAISALHAKGLEGILLDPHLVWLGFDGAVLLLDAPTAPILKDLAPTRPDLAQALSEQGLPAPLLQRDLMLLARLGYAMLSLDPLPHAPEAMVNGIRAWAAGEGRPAPEGLLSLFRRMTGLGEPFRDLLEFQFVAGQLLNAEDHAPSTFSLAFLLQTVFRTELRQEEMAMAVEREQAWTLSGSVPVLPQASVPAEPRQAGRPAWMRGAVVAGLLAAVGGGYALVHRQNQEAAASLRAELVAMQRREAEMDQKRAELDAAAQREAQARLRLEQELKAAQDLSKQETLKREMEAARQRENELQRQRAQVQAERQAQQERQAALEKKAAQSKPSPSAPPSPVVAPPSPSPAPVKAVPPPPAASPAVADQAAQMLHVPTLSQHGEGRVRVRVFVSETGRPLRALVALAVPSGRGLEDLAIQAALQGTYQPAVQGGVPTKAWVEVDINAK